MPASDKLLANNIGRLRLAEHQSDHGALTGRGAGHRLASESIVFAAGGDLRPPASPKPRHSPTRGRSRAANVLPATTRRVRRRSRAIPRSWRFANVAPNAPGPAVALPHATGASTDWENAKSVRQGPPSRPRSMFEATSRGPSILLSGNRPPRATFDWMRPVGYGRARRATERDRDNVSGQYQLARSYSSKCLWEGWRAWRKLTDVA